MSDPMTHAWQEVADSFTSLGRTMRDRYERPATPEERAAADADAGAERPRGDPAAALREAFESLLAAGREFGDRATGLVRDDDVKAELKHVAASLNGALEATVDQIGQEVRGFFKGSRHDETIETDEHAAPAGDITDAEPPGTDTTTRANTSGADDDRA